MIEVIFGVTLCILVIAPAVTLVRSLDNRDSDQTRLESLCEIWLADERPAFETYEAFECDVERVLRGDETRVEPYPVSKMPLRPLVERLVGGLPPVPETQSPMTRQ